MDRIALYHLRTLVSIARLGTFRAAAERLNTTQPAISGRVRELEQQLGVQLFKRDGRRMSLTPRGRQLVSESEAALAQLDNILDRASTGAASGVVRIGTGEIAAASCVSVFVERVQRRFPAVRMEIEVDLTARMLESLIQGRSDIVFLAGPVLHPGIRTASLGSLDVLWVCSQEVGAGFDDGRRLQIWTLPAHSPLNHIALKLAPRRFDASELSINTCNNVMALKNIVQHGGGIGLLPETMVRVELELGRLVELHPRPVERIEFQVAVRRSESDQLLNVLFELGRGLQVDPMGPDAPAR